MARKLTTFIISGRPQAGKSTVLNQLLQHTTPKKAAVIGDNSPKTGPIVPQAAKIATIRHAAGCSCCNPSLELPEQVQNLASRADYEYLFIESSATDDPATIAESLVYEQDVADIAAMITVID